MAGPKAAHRLFKNSAKNVDDDGPAERERAFRLNSELTNTFDSRERARNDSNREMAGKKVVAGPTVKKRPSPLFYFFVPPIMDDTSTQSGSSACKNTFPVLMQLKR